MRSKLSLLILLTLLFSKAWSQDSLDYAFVNSVYEDIVFREDLPYYLGENADTLLLTAKDLIKVFKDYLPEEELIYMISNKHKYKWNQKFLKHAICSTDSELNLMLNPEELKDTLSLFIPEAPLIPEAIRNNHLAGFPGNYKKYKKYQLHTAYYFSSPVFSSKKDYAIIDMMSYSGPLAAHGCVYLYHYVNGHWWRIGKAHCWWA